MAKKLKVELEVDNTEAKRKAKEVAEAASSQRAATPVASPAVPTPASIAPQPMPPQPTQPKPVTPVEIPVKQPEPVEIPVEQPKPVTVEVNEPKPVDVPVNEPKPVDVAVNAPKPVDVPVNQPKPVDVPVNEPKPVTVEVNAPKPVDVPVEQPDTVKVQVEQPGTVKVPVEEPKPTKVPVEEPKPVKIPIEKPKPVKIPVEQPKADGSAGRLALPENHTPRTPGADAGGKAKNLADGLDKASRSARNLSNGAEDFARSLKDVARSFAGLGVGMSMRFARQFVEQGSTADKALGIGENAATLGFMGAKMGGPWGGAIGTALGAAKGWMENEKADADRMRAEAAQRTANIESIQSWQKARAETLAFKATLDALTDSETSLADRQRMVAEEIKKREEAEKELARKAIREGGDVDATNPEKMAESQKAFAKAMAEYQANAAKLDQLKDMQKKLEKEAPDTPRPSFAASDALSRVGGAFAPTAGSDLRELVNGSRQQLASLREIAANTKQRVSSSWQ